MNQDLIHNVREEFTQRFKTDPLMVFSPGRINLIGEHVDYNDGFVFPAAVDKGIVLGIKKSDNEMSSAFAIDIDEMFSLDLNSVEVNQGGSWKNYLIGVIKELQKAGKKIEPFQLVFSGDVPASAGMSSSAALENAIVFAFNELFQLGLTKQEMIFISQKAEHNYVGVMCGIMDQFASMFGEEDHFLLLDCRSLDYKPYKVDLDNYELVLINSNVKHDFTENAYNQRRALCEKASKLMKKDSLRDVSVELLYEYKNHFSEEEFQMILFVIEEIQRTQLAVQAVLNKDIERLGEILYQGHNGLSQMYKVSCEEIDFLVNQTKRTNKVLGSRMMGGGFGGCTINIVESGFVDQFNKEISNAFADRFNYKCTPIQIQISQGTHLIK